MKINQKEFCGETDRQAMAALVRAFSAGNLHVADLGYRPSSWALDYAENVGLWVNTEGQLLAWAVMQTPFWAIDYTCHPGAAHLHRQILAWADSRAHAILGTASGCPTWFVNVSAGQADRIRDLEEMGFASQANVGQDSWSKVRMLCSTPATDDAPPAGFVVRPLAGEKEVEAYVELHQAVFESKNMTVEWRRRILGCPERAYNSLAKRFIESFP